MPFLNVAGIDLQAVEMEELEAERIGVQRRSYGGSMRTSYRTEKRAWRVTHLEMAKAAYEALRSATTLGQHVACSGAGLPGSLTCTVAVTGARYVHDGGTGHYLVPQLLIVQV